MLTTVGIKANDHAEIYCPQYENISVKGMLEEARQDPGLMNYADKFLGDVQQAIPAWRHVWRAGQGLTPAAPAFQSFMGGARDIGSDIPFLRRFLTR